ncbi:MAG: Rrf2 family transcriptional regulator [Elusimicrobia bacterium]|nr:Rrf2 family transcriptional regulator [Elusimicrobiota bacterium]
MNSLTIDMFSLTTKSQYGVVAVLELAKNFGRGLIQIKDISSRHEISPKYLEQLLSRLVKAGLVRASRGKKGGYDLAKDPANISFLEVMEALEGKLEITDTSPDLAAVKKICEKSEQEIKDEFQITLAELLLRQEEFAKEVMYHI